MAQNKLKVFLCYEDEIITDKNKYLVNFTTSKIGGKPDWPFLEEEPKHPSCPLCGIDQLLIVQVYAPLENSPYHRTLYVFGCINPNCWNRSESWTCLRSQMIDQSFEPSKTYFTPPINSPGIGATEWLKEADDWGDGTNDNISEENGNVINFPMESQKSDEDDESCSLEDSLRAGLEDLCVDSKNANNGSLSVEAQAGAVGKLQSPTATAEIEGEESEIVSIDTPTAPQRNIMALLQEVTTIPPELFRKSSTNLANHVEFNSSFINVGEEDESNGFMSEHIRELLSEYQLKNEHEDLMQGIASSSDGGDSGAPEKYEKSVPAHGDRLFHFFITKVQGNPGQVIRYSRGNPTPLLITPLTEAVSQCSYCKSPMIFEMQLMPTLISKLTLKSSSPNTKSSHIEFGTVLIFTCERSCWNTSDNVRREAIVVQNERL